MNPSPLPAQAAEEGEPVPVASQAVVRVAGRTQERGVRPFGFPPSRDGLDTPRRTREIIR